MIRKPAVAGQFYPESEHELYGTVKKYIEAGSNSSRKATAIISPHAGYVFSGRVAGLTYSEVSIPDTAVIIGPNHTGRGSPASVMTHGKWEIPGGNLFIDERTASKILEKSRFAEDDSIAHLNEHSIEVQLPFLLYKNPNVKIVPLCIAGVGIDGINDLGESIAHAVQNSGRKTLIVVSSDMSHYVSKREAERLDRIAINEIKKLDCEGLIHAVAKHNISMCGAVPAAVMLKAARMLRSDSAREIDYATSADVSGDSAQVVGYAGMVVD